MGIINNPHDKIFKEIMGKTETAKEFLANYLPEEVLQAVDLGNLAPEKDTYIDNELKESCSDKLFKTTINNRDAYIYLLFEHKSYQPKGMALQLLKYLVKIWEQKFTKEQADHLPIIIPLVIYHGENKWSIDRTLSKLIPDLKEVGPNLKKYIPDFEYLLYDFSPEGDEVIQGDVELMIFLEIFRAVYYKEVSMFLESLKKGIMLIEINNQSGETGEASETRNRNLSELFKTLILYIINVRSDVTVKEIYETAKEISPERGEEMQTIAEQLISEGMEKGIEKGMEKRNTEIALSSLSIGLPVETITKLTGLSTEKIEQLKQENKPGQN